MGTLKFVLAYTRRYRLPLVLTTLSMIGLVTLDLSGPLIIRRLIAAVQDPTGASGGIVLAGRLALLTLAIFIVRGLLQFVSSYQGHVAGWGVVADSRRHVYEHLQRLSLRFYEDQQTGQLMSRVVNDTNLFESSDRPRHPRYLRQRAHAFRRLLACC